MTHILNACRTYAQLLKQVVTSSNAAGMKLLISPQSQNQRTAAETSSGASGPSTVLPEYALFFAPSITYATQQVPGGVMKRIALFRYLSPSGGIRSISAEAVAQKLKAANAPFVTDLIAQACDRDAAAADAAAGGGGGGGGGLLDEAAMLEQLKELPYTEIDLARFVLVVLWELQELRCFTTANLDAGDGDGGGGGALELTPLAKRDMKKSLSSAAAAATAAANAAGGDAALGTTAAAVAGAAAAGGGAASSAAAGANNNNNARSVTGVGTAQGARQQRNLRGLLEEEAAAAWPHTPVDKLVVFAVEQDPDRPRRNPLFRATVEIKEKKNVCKVTGDWMPNKRDAENSAADKALPQLRRMARK